MELQSSDAPRTTKATLKAVYNRSYVRGFARPPPPPADPIDAAAAADTATSPPLPPPVVAAEDDPTSNQYQAPIFRQPLSLAQLLDICSDPLILSSLPTRGVHVTRLTAQGKPREYVMYRCSVCGKEVGDKSKHKKHEASCKKRILKLLNAAEKEEERQKTEPAVTHSSSQRDKEQDKDTERERGKEERKRRRTVAVPAGAAASETARLADGSSRSAAPLARFNSPQPGIEKSELYKLELKKQLKWIWHTMDVNPATCLLSRDSVLARIDLAQMFTHSAGDDSIFSLLSDEERDSLMQYLPQLDQAATRGGPEGGVKQEFPPPRASPVLATFHSTVASPVFLRSLDEYKRMLMSGSLDPALKGLRMMAAARRRRQQREATPSKQVETETYWGERLSEIRVNAKVALGRNGRSLLGGWRGLLGKRHKAVPAGPSTASQNGHAEDKEDGSRRASEDEEQSGDGAAKDEDAEATHDEDEQEQSTRTASDTDTDNHASDGTENEEQSVEEGAEEDTKAQDEDEEGGRRPLHRTRRRQPAAQTPKRSKQPSSRRARPRPRSSSEQSSDSSPYSAMHIDSLLPLPLQLRLPPASLPDVVPSMQRFHMRSPRFRRVRYARFVLKDGRSALIEARSVAPSSSRSPSGSAVVALKQRGKRGTPPRSPPRVAFSHLPRSIAKQCMQLQRQMMSAGEKQAAQQRITMARSVRVKQLEQDRLQAALEAEQQMLQLIEATASVTSSSSGSARRREKRREREDEERQQRRSHGMKRPRGFYAAGEAAEEEMEEQNGVDNDMEEDDEEDEQQQSQAEEDGPEMDGSSTLMEDHSIGSSVDDEEPLRRSVGNGRQHQHSAAQSDGELGHETKVETHLYTPVFPRGKFGFSSFIKHAVSNRV